MTEPNRDGRRDVPDGFPVRGSGEFVGRRFIADVGWALVLIFVVGSVGFSIGVWKQDEILSADAMGETSDIHIVEALRAGQVWIVDVREFRPEVSDQRVLGIDGDTLEGVEAVLQKVLAENHPVLVVGAGDSDYRVARIVDLLRESGVENVNSFRGDFDEITKELEQ